MARLLRAYHISINPSSLSLSNITSFFIFLAGVTGILSVIMFLCTTYKHSKISKASQSGLVPSSPPSPPQRENKFLSHLSSKALVVVKMVSWKKIEEEEDDVDDDDQAVWRKAIIMGDKCRPPNFSGQILYDSQGNPLPEPPARSLQRHEMF